MTGRRDQEARPSNARPTKRDVPLARGIEQPAGTSPPAGLRGRQLEPGQGAPERHDPSQVELAVLREADTLDPPELSRSGSRQRAFERAAAESSQPVPSPSPTPVSVEVPRVRSVPPLEAYASVGSSGKTRSVQSGTLLSVGAVDPRAATERRLEAPRMFLSQSEHEAQAYFKAKTVPPTVRPRDEPLATIQIAEPSPLPMPDSAPASAAQPRAASVGSGRRAIDSSEADSSVPPAQRVPAASERRAPSERRVASEAAHSPGRAPRSVESPRPTPSTDPSPVSDGSRPHADLSGFQSEEGDSDFDLRGVPTDREPLARRARVASDPELRQPSWIPSEPMPPAREVSTLPAAPELTPALPTRISPAARSSLPDVDLITPSASRRRLVPIGAAALMVCAAIWLGLSTRPAEPSPQAPQAAEPAAARAASPLIQQPAALLAPPPALPSAPLPALSAASLPLPAPSAAAPSPSARPADSARAGSSASAPSGSALPAPAPALPSSGLDAPARPAARPAPEPAPAPAHRSIY